ncbi:MAG: Mur ligase family protein, partial [Holophaga sp.]|nr:Mur ligase family protein [Holophaga sp.]
HWGIKMGLANPRALLEGLGHPERGIPCILIAGTNGKGSTGAFLAQALRSCGLTVGWTTSPHLVAPTERIWIDGHYIGASALDLLLCEAFDCEARMGLKATYFELMITAALLGFRMTGVEVAIIEVGMGGRWDATNALDPMLTVLTNVGLDHTKFLGETVDAIGREKLCTARQGRPLVLGPTLDPAWVWPLLECRPEIHPAPALCPEETRWDHSLVDGHRVGLPGVHQMENLATAMEALRQLRRIGFPVPEEKVWEGLAHTRWPGRIWPMPSLENVWLDGAHNPDGARVLARHAQACGVRPHLFFGAMGDKDLSQMASALKAMNPASVTLVRGENERYASVVALRAAWGEEFPARTIPEVAASLRQSREGIRLVTGSLFLLGDLMREMGIVPQT